MPTYDRFFIAEKGSLAEAIAKGISDKAYRDKNGGWIAGNDYVYALSGHVLELMYPEELDPSLKIWRFDTLPLPPKFQHKVKEDKPGARKSYSAEKVSHVKKMLQDCNTIVNAGDNDREGQMLVDELLEYLHNSKPVLRIHVSSYEKRDVAQSLSQIKDNKLFYTTYLEALARQRMDYILGLSLTRALTLLGRKKGYSNTLHAGRVKSVALSMLVERDLEIENFKPIDYFTLSVQFKHQNGSFSGRWSPREDQEGMDAEGRLVDKAVAFALAKKLVGSDGMITKLDKGNKADQPPSPFSLTDLVSAAAKKLGFSMDKTNALAQELYETYKITTYPRTDTGYLKTSHFDLAKEIVDTIINNSPELEDTAKLCTYSTKTKWFNDKEAENHHGIIPTRHKLDKNLPDDHRKLYNLICCQFMAQVAGLWKYNSTKIEVKAQDERFTASGKITTEPGWTAILSPDKEDGILPTMQEKDPIKVSNVENKPKKTTPPPKWTDASLAEAMKEAHKYVKNQEYKKKLSETEGVGTEATRANIIKSLIEGGYCNTKNVKSGLELTSTEIAKNLFKLLPDFLKDPGYSALFETELTKIRQGTQTEAYLLKAQETTIYKVLENIKEKLNDKTLSLATGPACPICKSGKLQRRSKKDKSGFYWLCSGYPECKCYCPDLKNKPELSKASLIGDAKPKSEEFACPVCNEDKVLSLENGGGYLQPLEFNGKKFWGCSNFKNNCKTTRPDYQGKPDILYEHSTAPVKMTKDFPCPECNPKGNKEKGGYLQPRSGTKGSFWGCSNYNKEGKEKCTATRPDYQGTPDVNYTHSEKPVASTKNYPCPKCNPKGKNPKGFLQPRKGKTGIFWGCDAFPDCKTIIEDKEGKPAQNKKP